MGEEKEEYEVGIPLDDLTSDSVPEKIDSNSNVNDDPSTGSPAPFRRDVTVSPRVLACHLCSTKMSWPR